MNFLNNLLLIKRIAKVGIKTKAGHKVRMGVRSQEKTLEIRITKPLFLLKASEAASASLLLTKSINQRLQYRLR